MDKLVVKVLIQDNLTVVNAKKELDDILTNESRISELKKDYSDLKSVFRKGGNAAEKVASSIIQFLSEN